MTNTITVVKYTFNNKPHPHRKEKANVRSLCLKLLFCASLHQIKNHSKASANHSVKVPNNFEEPFTRITQKESKIKSMSREESEAVMYFVVYLL